MTNWIKSFLEKSVEKRWCTKYLCTTCGANDFRTCLWETADKYNKISLNSSDTAVATICKELYALSYDDIAQINKSALRLIFTEIYERNYSISDKSIKEILKDSPAGNYLKSMEEHARQLDLAYGMETNPTLIAERRRIKKELKAKTHTERVKKYKNIYYGKKINLLIKKHRNGNSNVV